MGRFRDLGHGVQGLVRLAGAAPAGMQLVTKIVLCPLKFLHGLTHASSQTRQSFGSEQNKDNEQDYN